MDVQGVPTTIVNFIKSLTKLTQVMDKFGCNCQSQKFSTVANLINTL